MAVGLNWPMLWGYPGSGGRLVRCKQGLIAGQELGCPKVVCTSHMMLMTMSRIHEMRPAGYDHETADDVLLVIKKVGRESSARGHKGHVCALRIIPLAMYRSVVTLYVFSKYSLYDHSILLILMSMTPPRVAA